MSRISQLVIVSFLALSLIACSATPTDPNTSRAGRSMPERTFDYCRPWSPTPARVVAGRAPIYPVNRFIAGHDGYAIVEFEISDQGKAGNFVNVESSHSSFYAHTKLAIQDWTFEPAIIDGEPVTVHCRFRQDFTVKNKSLRQRMSQP